MCPLQHYGNSGTGLCQPCKQHFIQGRSENENFLILVPSNYILSLNSTHYFANINSEVTINTTIFHLQLSINLNRVSPSDIIALTFGFSQSQLVQELFEFENGESDNEFEARDHVHTLDTNTGIVDAAIILVALPDTAHYPVNLHMSIRVLLLYINASSGAMDSKLAEAEAVGSIVHAQSKF